MIPYGENGKIEAYWLLTEVLERNLVSFPDEAVVSDGLHHRIRDAVFSEEVKSIQEIRENFREIVSGVLDLYAFLEEDESLIVPAELLGKELLPYVKNEFLSGTTLLNLFGRGLLKLQKTADTGLALQAGLLFTDNVEKPEKVLNSLSEGLLRFNSDENQEKSMEIVLLPTDLAREEAVFYEEYVNTEEPMSVSYEQEEGIERYVESGIATEEELNRTMEADDPFRIIEPDDNARSAMTQIRGIFDEMEDVSEAVSQDPTKYILSYKEGKTYHYDHFTMLVPDGYAVTEEEDGFVLYLPNEENPDEWEASVFILLSDGFYEGADIPGGMEINSVYDGSSCDYKVRVAFGKDALGFRISMTGVSPERKREADHMVQSLLSGVWRDA